MSDSNSSSTNFGTSILGLLGILFIGLKLTGYITWSWWWVLAPFWGGFALVAFAIFAYVAYRIYQNSKGVPHEDRK